jgi:4'-phosphopantetheinyl transferase
MRPAPPRTPPALAGDEVHVRRLRAGSRAQAGRALHEVLAAYLATSPDAVRLAVGPHGKPELAGGGLNFNLSHSGDLALVAVTRERAVGVDVERINPRRDVLALVERALDAEAAAAVRSAPASDRLAVFHLAWARREAVVKCAGTGLDVPPPDTVRQVIDLDVGDGYAAALAVGGAAPVRVELLA